jgi:hypothetical protein
MTDRTRSGVDGLDVRVRSLWREPGELSLRTLDFRFLAPGTRLNAFSKISAIWGRRRLVRRAGFGECETQKLIPRDLAEYFSRGPWR